MESRLSYQGAGRVSRKSNISPVPVMVSVPLPSNSQPRPMPQLPEAGSASAPVSTVGAAYFASSAAMRALRTSSGRPPRNWSRMSPAPTEIRWSNWA